MKSLYAFLRLMGNVKAARSPGTLARRKIRKAGFKAVRKGVK